MKPIGVQPLLRSTIGAWAEFADKSVTASKAARESAFMIKTPERHKEQRGPGFRALDMCVQANGGWIRGGVSLPINADASPGRGSSRRAKYESSGDELSGRLTDT